MIFDPKLDPSQKTPTQPKKTGKKNLCIPDVNPTFYSPSHISLEDPQRQIKIYKTTL
jgi:hypothetical protein